MSTTLRFPRRYLLAATLVAAVTGTACTTGADKSHIPAQNNAGTPVVTNLTALTSTGTTGNAQSDSAGSTLPFPAQARVNDQNGNPMIGVTVNWAPKNSSSGSVAAATSLTDDAGIARMAWTVGNIIGADSLVASTGTLSVNFGATVTARGAVVINKVASTDNQSVAAGTKTGNISVMAADGFGNGTAGAVVAWTMSGVACGSLSATSSTSVATTGLASTVLTTSATVGTCTVSATWKTQAPVNFTVTTH